MNIADLNRWEAMNIIGMSSIAVAEGRWGDVCVMLGLTEEIAADLTTDDLMGVISVRMTLIADRAGMREGPTP